MPQCRGLRHRRMVTLQSATGASVQVDCAVKGVRPSPPGEACRAFVCFLPMTWSHHCVGPFSHRLQRRQNIGPWSEANEVPLSAPRLLSTPSASTCWSQLDLARPTRRSPADAMAASQSHPRSSGPLVGVHRPATTYTVNYIQIRNYIYTPYCTSVVHTRIQHVVLGAAGPSHCRCTDSADGPPQQFSRVRPRPCSAPQCSASCETRGQP